MHDENPSVGDNESADASSTIIGMSVYAARDGMAYRGPIVDGDARYHYQQVAPNTLIAHARDDGTAVAALESDALGASLTAMYENEGTRQSALDAARELGSDPHASMPAALSAHYELREAFESGRGDAYGIDY
jgi:hypothetical protein